MTVKRVKVGAQNWKLSTSCRSSFTLIFTSLMAIIIVVHQSFYQSSSHRKSLPYLGTSSKYAKTNDFDSSSTKDFQFEYENPIHKFPLPDWIETFLESQSIATHNTTLADPNEKFIVLTCHKYKETEDEACGGLSDRLMHLPYYIWLANHTGRRLLIKYSTPHPLEEFFVPPEDGFDWRLPDEYVATEWETYANRSFQQYRDQRRMIWHQHIDKSPWKESRFIFANTNLAKPDFTKMTGIDTTDVWPGIFRRMFKPSKALGEAIDDFTKNLGLIPGTYGAAHIRARWPGGFKLAKGRNEHSGVDMTDEKTKKNVHDLGDLAIKCVTKVMPDTQFVYVSTDTYELLDYLLLDSPKLTWDGENKNLTVITRPNYNKPSLHFNTRNHHGESGTAPPEEFFQIFIDLWMMAHSKCFTQGLGGFGHFGSMLSGNHLSCRTRHRDYNLGLLDFCPTPKELKMIKKLLEEEKKNK